MTGCKVLGAVLNGVDMKASTNRRYYYRGHNYHSYGYGYGYGKNAERLEKVTKTESKTVKKPQSEKKTSTVKAKSEKTSGSVSRK